MLHRNKLAHNLFTTNLLLHIVSTVTKENEQLRKIKQEVAVMSDMKLTYMKVLNKISKMDISFEKIHRSIYFAPF